MTPLSHTDAAIAELVRVTAAQQEEAADLFARADRLDAEALRIGGMLGVAKRATASWCRETARAISHAATLAQLEGSVR